MKKLAIFILLMFVICVTVLSAGVIAQAATIEEECDTVFFETLQSVLEQEGMPTSNNIITKQPLFDMNLDQLGFVYDMTFESCQGFAIVVNTVGIFEVVEIYIEGVNPYSAYDGMYIYVSAFTYLVYQNNQFIETTTGLVLDNDTLNSLYPRAFYSVDYGYSQQNETVTYVNRVNSEYQLATVCPEYEPVNLTNGCTPAAGGSLIGYYTRYYPELMPGYTPGTALGSFYMYKAISEEAIALVQTLYTYMETNVDAPGTTIAGFKSGLIRYCNEKGRNISFTTCMQNGVLNYSLAKQFINNGWPLALFLDNFNIVSIGEGESSENIHYFIVNGCHTMVAFGHREITYTFANGSTRNDKYFFVSTGLGVQSSGYYNVNYCTQIDEAYTVNVY